MSLKYEVFRINDNIRYYRHGEYHRMEGPAILWADGEMFWRQYSSLRRATEQIY